VAYRPPAHAGPPPDVVTIPDVPLAHTVDRPSPQPDPRTSGSEDVRPVPTTVPAAGTEDKAPTESRAAGPPETSSEAENPTSSAVSAPLTPLSADSVMTLRLRQIRGKDFINVEIFGKNDPYVRLKFRDWCPHTDYLEDTEDSVTWDMDPADRSWVLRLEYADIRDGELEVQAMDKNRMTADALIGSGTVSFKDIAGYTAGGVFLCAEEREAVVPIWTAKKKRAGEVTLRFMLTLGDTSGPGDAVEPSGSVQDHKVVCHPSKSY